MADQLQLRGGSTAEHSTFTGALREVTVDIDKDTVVVHDNATAGGHPLLREDLSNLPAGTIDNADINASAAIAGTKIDPDFGSQTVETTGVFSAAGGAQATPSITFTGDLNTGIYSPGADQVAVATNGVGRLFVNASGNVGVGTTSPAYPLVVASNITSTLQILSGGSTNQSRLFFADANDIGIGRILYDHNDNSMQLYANNTERLRIDSSGRLLVGTSSALSGSGINANYNSSNALLQVVGNSSGTPRGATFALGRSQAASAIIANDFIGGLIFSDNASAEFAHIFCYADAAAGTGDHPSRLVFSTTADGASAPTERMRIGSNGNIIFNFNGSTATGTSLFADGTAASPGLSFWADGSSDTGIFRPGANILGFTTGGTERARIDSSGRLLVGSSTGGDVNYGGGTGGFHLVNGNADPHLMIRRAGGNGSLTLVRSNGTVAAPTVVANNDVIGQIRFVPYDGTDYTLQCARISAEIDGTPGANDVPGRLVFSTTADGANTPTERLRITSAGRVGIGTTSPYSLLDLGSSLTGQKLSIYADATYRIGLGALPNEFRQYTHQGGFISWGHVSTSDQSTFTERARIDSSGRLLVGTSTASSAGNAQYSKLEISGNTGNSFGSGSLTLKRGEAASGMSNGDLLARVIFSGLTGGDFAYIDARVDGSASGSDFPGALMFSTTADGASSSTERMRITSSGKFKFSDSGSYISAAGTSHEFRNGSSNNVIRFSNTNATPYGNIIEYENAAPNSTGQEFLVCQDTSTSRFRFRSNGGLANYQSNDANLCDEREKKNIVDLDSTWNCLKDWELKKFHYNEDADSDDKRYGVIAQQVAAHCPEVITDWVKQEAKEAVLDEDGNVVTPAQEEIVRMGVKEQQMMWMAIKALQEAQTRIETLEAEVAALKGA
jgi:hypothetical protein